VGIALGTLALKKNKMIFGHEPFGRGIIAGERTTINDENTVAETAVEMMVMVETTLLKHRPQFRVHQPHQPALLLQAAEIAVNSGRIQAVVLHFVTPGRLLSHFCGI
jgi:hypothetical protein